MTSLCSALCWMACKAQNTTRGFGPKLGGSLLLFVVVVAVLFRGLTRQNMRGVYGVGEKLTWMFENNSPMAVVASAILSVARAFWALYARISIVNLSFSQKEQHGDVCV